MSISRRDDQVRYGIAELFGRPIDRLRKEERDRLLDQALNSPVGDYPACPFRLPSQTGLTRCSKRYGVCSIRRYRNDSGTAQLALDAFEERIRQQSARAIQVTNPYVD
jgi:hypothetical protein